VVRTLQDRNSLADRFPEKYGPKGFTVVGVAMDEGGQKIVQPYVQSARFDMEDGSKQGIDYPVVLGTDALSDKFGVNGFPTGVLISRDGKLVKITSGLVSRDEMVKDIEAQIK